MTYANLTYANLTYAELHGANLYGAALSDTDLTEAFAMTLQQLADARISNLTRLPAGISPPSPVPSR